MARKYRIAVAGGGVVGSLVAAGLAGREDVEVLCFERSLSGTQLDAGTGLNIGPNAVKALRQFLPDVATQLVAGSFPWTRWTVALTDGTPLARFEISQLADNPGLRIGWAELNARLRASAGAAIRYGSEVVAAGQDCDTPFLQIQDDSGAHRLDDLDLLIAADGRYSLVRESLLASDPTEYPGVALFRLLCPTPPDCPIDDYSQWFNGGNRLLAFRIPGDLVYCAGSFPLLGRDTISETMKRPDASRERFVPPSGNIAEEVGYLLDAIGDGAAELHWSRLQERATRLVGGPRVVLAGDAAHPMLPTLGQGATQSIEDACVLVDEIRHALAQCSELSVVPGRFSERRQQRLDFVTAFSREATDTMLTGADPVVGTADKLKPAFIARLQRLYRDSPQPR